ncbi:methanol dehydrogenase [Croceicoccus estronivorus]|uniref:TPM domain-containing protein n=1 Tax=Croceicoccus estronivorus TaxID=1172626 RepID=UPI00082E034C|nr:TPM domain-containing protein [Croceicoccus estronivorus]OCC22580.1 methanol dehydrogenase [Croceicoccus estronivorus]
MLVLLVALAWPGLAVAQEFPPLTGRVVDAANVIPPDVEAQLTAKLEALGQQSQRQLVVATIPSLQGYEISDYGYRLGRHWGIGSKERNDGALLIVAPSDRQVRIEVGYGLEPVLTDGMSFLIINNDILPRFKAGDMPGGIVAGTDAIIKQLTLPEEEARQIAAKADERRQEGPFPFGLLIWLGFIFFFFVLPIIRGGGRRRRGAGPVILFPGGFSGGRSSGGFGGGFSGGGGSFGGGGASGRW